MARTSPLLGVHLSVAGGLHEAIYNAQKLECAAVQMFTHSNRQWAFTLPTTQAVEAFRRAKEASSVKTVVVHATYLMNPASPEKENRLKAVAMLKKELEACHMLDITYLVLHPGSALHGSKAQGAMYCADTINYALEATGICQVLIENMAGQGSVMGSKLEELAQIYAQIEQKERVGFCFDTCHGFAAGYDFTTRERYTAFWKSFDNLLGLSNLKVIHLNDSVKPFNAKVDRHAGIGQGLLPLGVFEYIMNDPYFTLVAKILETPKGDGLEEDRKNLARVKSLIR